MFNFVLAIVLLAATTELVWRAYSFVLSRSGSSKFDDVAKYWKLHMEYQAVSRRLNDVNTDFEKERLEYERRIAQLGYSNRSMSKLLEDNNIPLD